MGGSNKYWYEEESLSKISFWRLIFGPFSSEWQSCPAMVPAPSVAQISSWRRQLVGIHAFSLRLLWQAFHMPVATKVETHIRLVKETNSMNISTKDPVNTSVAHAGKRKAADICWSSTRPLSPYLAISFFSTFTITLWGGLIGLCQ